MNKALLTTHEAHVLFDLAEAWNKFALLPDHPPNDIVHFQKTIQDAQRIVLARVGRRQMQGIEGNNGPIMPEISLEDLKELAEQMKQLPTFSQLSARKVTHSPQSRSKPSKGSKIG